MSIFFIKLNYKTSNERIAIDVSKIESIDEVYADGCIICCTAGRKVAVKQSYKDIIRLMYSNKKSRERLI